MAKRELSFIERIEDKFGDLIVFDETKEKERIKAISTSALSLDVSTGVGGIPLRRFTQIDGVESSGKTTLALSICQNAIKEHDVLYIDAEQTLDFDYARRIIGDFDTNKFTLIQPETAEQALEIAENGVKSKEFGLIILDSVGALIPQKVLDDDLTDSNVALVARIMTKFLGRTAFTVRSNDVAFLFINQVRAKIGGYVASFEVPGGYALKHILSLRISLNRAEDIKMDKDIIGINTRFTIRKNKLASPFKSFILPIMFGKGIDSLRDTVMFAEFLGVLDRRGPYYFFDGETLGSGLMNTMNYFAEHKEILDKVVQRCYTIGNILTKEKEDEQITIN